MRYLLKFQSASKLACLMLLTVLLLIFLLGPYINIAAEDLQTFLYPFVLFACWGLFRALNVKLIDGAAIVAAIVWLIGVGNTRAAYPFGFVLPGPYISRLDGDTNGMAAREFKRSYNLVAERSGLDSLRLLQRNFVSAEVAHSWHSEKSNLSLLLSGSTSGLTISLPGAPWPRPRIDIESEAELEALLAAYGLRDSAHLRMITFDGAQTNFILVEGIDEIGFSMLSASAAVSFLPWFAEGFAKTDLQEKKVGFGTATQMLGPWRSGAVLGAAHFYLALAELVDAEEYDFSARTQLDCAKRMLERAAAYTAQAKEPELTSAIFNNSGVLRLLVAYRVRHFSTVRKLLLHAAAMADDKGQPVLAARVAMVNLILLDRAGIDFG